MGIEFWLTSLIVVVAPGTGAIYTLAAGLARGGRAGVIAAFGCTLGIVPHMLAAVTGLAALLHTSALAFEALRYLGIAYLLYMAWMVLREKGALQVEADRTDRRPHQVIVQAILLNLLNPKLSIFFLAFLPQFPAPAGQNALVHMLLQSAAFMALTFAVFALYGLFAGFMRGHVLSRPAVLAWMRRGFALAFLALGARLALTQR